MAACVHGMPTPASCITCMEDDGLGVIVVARPTIEATFAARFDGHCPGCSLPINTGQTIHKLSNERYVHEGCE